MIRVRVVPGDVPQDWLDRAQELLDELIACVDDGPEVEDGRTAAQKRKALIDANQAHWRNLKPTLMAWSHQKCWYSELRDEGSDLHVDHFRPKGRVRNPGEADREGYWWLAFDWRNYRMAVAWCNSPHKGEDGEAKGKHDQFPLGPRGVCASQPADDLETEDVVLLDPIDPDDVALIDFDEWGMPVPAGEGWTSERVTKTVDVLHLDAPRMKEARQGVWRRCRRLLDETDQLVNQEALNRGALDRKMLRGRFAEIRELLAPTAELSAVARACVRRSTYPWALALLAA